MKKAFAVAAIFVAGAGAIGAGAFGTSPYLGSDALYNVTNQAILNAQLGNNPTSLTAPPQWNATANPIGDYTGGGSVLGEYAMIGFGATPQQTAPMSSLFEVLQAGVDPNSVCAVSDLSRASGIVLGIDSLSLLAANAVIGANTACNGAASNGPCTQDPSGLAFSQAGGNPMGVTNWRDVLALLYGGLDRSTNVTDCNSTKRQTLVSNWANLFQNSSCTNGTGTAAALTHAWRLDDFSGESDVFAKLIGIEANWKDPNGNVFSGFTANGAAVNGFGTSPYCNAMNWDQGEVDLAACSNALPNHYIGPGGVVGSDGKHRLPPAGTYGSVPAGSQPFVLSTSFQDNDPIRGICLGNASTHRAAEDVCNTDGKLGVVLPIPALDFVKVQIPGAVAFPAGVQCTGGTSSGSAPKIFLCAPRGRGSFVSVSQCPNGDTPFAFGCLIPIGAGPSGPTSQCLTIKSEFPTLCNRIDGACSNEARIYNAQVYDGTAAGAVAYATQFIHYSGYTNVLSHAGGWGRIHMREVSTTGAKTCQLADASDQIGCLVQADQHSVGFAAQTAATWEARDPVVGHTGSGETVGLRVNGLGVGVSCTPAAPGSGLASYPLWHKLYLNSIVGFSRLTSSAELELAEFESFDQNISPILQNYGFFPLPFSPNGTDPTAGGGPEPYCEDFNQALLCGATSNTNACATNFAGGAPANGPLVNTTIPAFTSLAPQPVSTPGCAGLPAGSPGCTIPSDTQSDPTRSTTSTVCGNGRIEAFEDCDPAPPASSPNCSTSCRSTL
jgi:hypothetical protein